MNAALRSPLCRASLILLALLVLVAVFADLLASEAPLVMSRGGKVAVLPALTQTARPQPRSNAEWRTDLGPDDWAIWAPVPAGHALRAPNASGPGGSPAHLLGTDAHGYDVLARIVHGARTLVVITCAVLGFALLLGVAFGLIAGAGPRTADFLLTRSVELSSVLPALVLLALIRVGQQLPAIPSFVLVVGTLHAVRIARLVRGEVLSLHTEPFVVAATALGASRARVLLRHVLPHAAGPVLITAAFAAASVVALQAALGFVGLGLDEQTPSWGALLGQAGARTEARIWLLPALGIALTTAALYVVASAVEDAQKPRRRRALQAQAAARRAASADLRLG